MDLFAKRTAQVSNLFLKVRVLNRLTISGVKIEVHGFLEFDFWVIREYLVNWLLVLPIWVRSFVMFPQRETHTN